MTSVIEQLKARLVLILLVTLVLIISTAAIRMTHRHFLITRKISNVQAEVQELERERQTLEKSLTSLGDLATIERTARETLNLQKKGEQVVVLLPSGESQEKGDKKNSEANFGRKLSNLEKWWTYFFGRE